MPAIAPPKRPLLLLFDLEEVSEPESPLWPSLLGEVVADDDAVAATYACIVKVVGVSDPVELATEIMVAVTGVVRHSQRV